MKKYVEEYEKWLNFPELDGEMRRELEEIKDDEIAERFARDLEFGTGGMRGVLGAGTNRMNIYTVMRAGAGFAAYLKKNRDAACTRGVVISHDNRRKSREFAVATAGVFAAAGIKAYLFDSLRPTPELSFAVRRVGAIGGVMITASHNPPEYNGYKIYDEAGCQLDIPSSDEVIREIEKISDPLRIPCLSENDANGLIVTLPPEIDDEYCMRVMNVALSHDREAASDLRVVYSPQHGTGNIPVRRVLSECGYDVVPVLSQCDPDPDFSMTASPNPENAAAYDRALELAKEVKADIVITTDPDCDRLGVAVCGGKEPVLLTGNQSAAILLEYILARKTREGTMPESPLAVTTVVTSDVGEKICEAYGVKMEKTLTGFKFIGEKIARHNAAHDATFVFGYEESYGCLISDFVRDKDGVQASLMLCEAAAYYKKTGKTLVDALNDVYEKYGYYLDTQSNFYFKGLDGADKISSLISNLRTEAPQKVGTASLIKVEDYLSRETAEAGFPASNMLRFIFDNGSWVAVRPSGTEPKCKFYYCIHSSSYEAAEALLTEFKKTFEPQL